MSERLLRPILPHYGIPADAPLRLVNRSENETWTVDGGALFLRLHRDGYHSRNEIASELAWLSALQGLPGLNCVRPVADREGGLIQTAGGRHVVAFAPIVGREPTPQDDLGSWFAELGRITARLHAHARAWRRPPGFRRKRWDAATILGPRAHWGQWRAAEGLTVDGRSILCRLEATVWERLEAYGAGAERFGLIHGDLRLANLLIGDAGLWVIDFDDCGFGWWMFDFAAAVSFIETDLRLPELAARWLEGYRRERPLAAEDAAMLPALVMLRRVQLTAWLGTRADSHTAADVGGPAYTEDTVALAERFLTGDPSRFWGGWA